MIDRVPSPQGRAPHATPSRLAALGLVAALLGGGSACGLFGDANEPAGTKTIKQAVCRPPSAKKQRGDAPWSVGDTTPSGWTVSAIEDDNPEYVRFAFTKADAETKIEVKYHEGAPDDWATASYRLMPAPEHEPPQALLLDAIATLRAFQESSDGAPFVFRTEGVDDPFDGLEDCRPGQEPYAIVTYGADEALELPVDPAADDADKPEAATPDGTVGEADAAAGGEEAAPAEAAAEGDPSAEPAPAPDGEAATPATDAEGDAPAADEAPPTEDAEAAPAGDDAGAAPAAAEVP